MPDQDQAQARDHTNPCDGGNPCILHENLSVTLVKVNEKLDAITPQLEDLTWIKTIGRFLIGIIVTLFFTSIPLTYNLFTKMSDILVRINLNTQAVEVTDKSLEKHEDDAKEIFGEIKDMLKEVRDDIKKYDSNKRNGG